MPDGVTGDAAASNQWEDAPITLPAALLTITLTITTLFCASPAIAEIRVVTSQGEHRMGDRDTREDAVRLATEAAKRNALEQVATYLESITVVDGVDITKDEIRTYTTGLVLVLDQQTNVTLDGDTVVVTVDLTAQIDSEEVVHAIVALRENEDARQQLASLKDEIDALQQELESANQALALASTPEEVQQASQQRQEILNRVQSNAMVSQAWTDWVIVSPVAYPYPWVGVAQTQALLNVARGLYPASPYVQTAQQVIVTTQPPSQPPSTTPTTRPVQPQPGSRPVPLTLNEIPHTTPTAPPHLGAQPAENHQMVPAPTGSRTLTDVRQLNPLLPPPNSTPITTQQVSPNDSRSAQTFQPFLQPPGTAAPQNGQPSVARRLPPTINQIHPPLPQQVPRVPYQVAPRGFGGGGRGSGGHVGGGGGRAGGGRGR
ncbi:MAG TPA: hypothetical protein VF819_04440 [Nitrospira sp.]